MPEPTVWLVSGTERVELRGRAAQMAAVLAMHQVKINAAGGMGKVVLNYAGRTVVPVLEESLGKHELKAA